MLGLSERTSPVPPNRPTDPKLAGPHQPRSTLSLAYCVPDLATYRALKGRAYALDIEDITRPVTLHIIIDDQPTPARIRLALARLGLIQPELLHLREVNITTGYEANDDE
jgi:hypothetical protein